MRGRWVLWMVLVGSMSGSSWVAGQSLGVVVGVDVGDRYCGDADRNLSQSYTCAELVIACDGAENRPVQLRVTSPPEGVEVVGTIVFGMGGSGRGFYENAQRGGHTDLPAAEMLDRLNLAGYRVVQRAWRDRPNEEPGGWINGSTSLVISACRYATLIDWIGGRPALFDPEKHALCAVGQSGGASEIGYGLAHYGLDAWLDLALLTGGPPHGALEGGCDPGSQAWVTACNANLETLGVCPEDGPDEHRCVFDPRSIERNVDAGFDLNPPPDDTPCALVDTPTLVANSVLSDQPDLDHPSTAVSFLVGARDCGTSPAMASPYVLAVLGSSTGPAAFATVPGVSHAVPAFPAGAAAVESVLTAAGGCVRRHDP